VIKDKNEISTSFVQLKPLRELEVVEGEYDEVIQGHILSCTNDVDISFLSLITKRLYPLGWFISENEYCNSEPE
jgi:hypothetical protein